MLGILIFLTALSSTVYPIICSRRHSQLDAVVKLLENQLTHAKHSSSSQDTSSASHELYKIKGNNLKAMDVINLIKQARDDDNNKVTLENKRPRYKSESNRYDFNQILQNLPDITDRNDRSNDLLKNTILDQLKTDNRNQQKKRKTVIPNRLLSPVQNAYENEDRKSNSKGSLSDYSKIYVILDPVALQNSKNTDDLSSLLSRILLQPSSAAEMSGLEKTGINRYKGFLVKDDARSRRYRQSMENDDNDDFRPKRIRSDRMSNSGGGGGGGSGGGRTAIPYIRHRGDIYEKDH